MNARALTLPADALAPVLQECVARKAEVLRARDRALGENRVRIGSYMENIGWPELFGYDMNDFYRVPELSFEMQLRQNIFWADNSEDDWPVGLEIGASIGHYTDMTLFGASIRHTADGVPLFDPHPMAQELRLDLLPEWDFQRGGDMPRLISYYQGLKRISEERYGGVFPVVFPCPNRGCLDTLVQLRTYEEVVVDMRERPEAVHAFLAHFADARLKYFEGRRVLLGESSLPEATHVADDWVNVPFISPAMFREFMVPAYRRISANERTVASFHTCGRMEPLVGDLLEVFPKLSMLDVSGWNDFELLHRTVPKDIGFGLSFINTFTLTAPGTSSARSCRPSQPSRKSVRFRSARRPSSTSAAPMKRRWRE